LTRSRTAVPELDLAAEALYTLVIDHEGYTPIELNLTTKTDLNLELIALDK
jgi:hypothetical protein|tara:strand:- start:463 stop:615 length:153 start_codon:yes stop_codon:yes gene_type:complete